jgi:phage replication O-like protein O
MSAQVENGYTRIANELVEALASTYLSPYEWQVLMAIFRKTYGYNKKSDWIANSQLSELTGIYKAHISRTTKKLVERGIVTQTGNRLSFNKDYSSWLPKQVTIKKVTQTGNRLSFNKDYSSWLPKQVTIKKVTQTGNTVTQMGIAELPKQVDTKDNTTKDNIQKKIYVPLNDLNDTHFEPIAQRYGVPISFVRSKYEDMVNWHESSGKTKKDWIATLRGFVKRDAIERIDHAKQNDTKRGIDASGV